MWTHEPGLGVQCLGTLSRALGSRGLWVALRVQSQGGAGQLGCCQGSCSQEINSHCQQTSFPCQGWKWENWASITYFRLQNIQWSSGSKGAATFFWIEGKKKDFKTWSSVQSYSHWRHRLDPTFLAERKGHVQDDSILWQTTGTGSSTAKLLFPDLGPQRGMSLCHANPTMWRPESQLSFVWIVLDFGLNDHKCIFTGFFCLINKETN